MGVGLPVRSAGIVINGDTILLMHRIKNGKEYWVFPGGTVEDGETPQEAVVREVLEETSIVVTSNDEPFFVLTEHEPIEKKHYFFLCQYTDGIPQLQENSPEKAKMDSGEQVYDPVWVPLASIQELTLYPFSVRDLVTSKFVSQQADQ